ncbi:MAG: hypothetical protein GY822_10350 [Deltaproteobacteria bacterium]|nr:hypothetical protein [Deltaproteobacteria bacterium]
MRRTSLLSLSVLTLTGAFLFSGCTVERGYENYSEAQPMMSQSFANMLVDGQAGYLVGQVGAVGVDAPASVNYYNDDYDDYNNSESVDLNVYDGNDWSMAGLWVENGSLNSLELGETYTFRANGMGNEMTASGIGCSDNGNADYYDETFDEVDIVVEEGSSDDERLVMFTGSFPNGNEVEGAFNLAAE